MADKHSLGLRRADFRQQRERATYRIAQALGHPRDYEPTRIPSGMNGDFNLVNEVRLEGLLLSLTELVERLVEQVHALRSDYAAMDARITAIEQQLSKRGAK